MKIFTKSLAAIVLLTFGSGKIFSQPLTVSISNSTNISCNGQCNGTADAMAQYGTSPYTYLWTGGQTNAQATGLCAGTYTVTVTDNVSATATATVTITSPTAVTSTVTPTAASCNGLCNGLLSATGSGGTTPYTYSWSGGLGSGASKSAVCAGTYTVTVTDANGCTVSASSTVSQPTTLTASISTSNISCNGGNGGSATITASGGTTPYSYSWNTSPAQTTQTATGLSAGSYTVTVTDANGCTQSASATLTQPTALSINTTGTSTICLGASANIASSVSGGTPAYTYNWSPGGMTTANITVSPSFSTTYTLNVTDANGCTGASNFAVTVNANPDATINPAGPFCTGDASVTLTAATGGGTFSGTGVSANTFNPSVAGVGTHTITYSVTTNGCTSTDTEPITVNGSPVITVNPTASTICNGSSTILTASGAAAYSWSPATGLSSTTGASVTATPISTTTYSVTGTDGNGCQGTVNVTVTVNANPAANAGADQTVCSTSDSVFFSGSGGTTYSWNFGDGNTSTQQNPTYQFSSPGVYNVTLSVTDASGCSATDSAMVTIGGGPGISTSSTNISCNGGCNGTASVTVSGGTAPFSYQWNNSDTTASITGLCAGSYTVTVTDANGCNGTSNIIITQPAALTETLSPVNATCGTNNGSISVSVNGGTPPYSYNWSPGGQTTQNISGLSAGSYSVTITDANSCSATDNAIVTSTGGPAVTISTADASCGQNNGSATVTASGGVSPYSYLWNDTLAQTSATATGLIAGTYMVTVTDVNSCTATGNATINNVSGPSVSVSSTNATCGNNNGSVSAIVSGGTSPYSFIWSNGSTAPNPSGLAAGTYTVTVTDSNNCTATGSATVNSSGGPTISTSSTSVSCFGGSDGSATVNVTGGTPPYTYIWSTGDSLGTINNKTPGNYSVTVTDNNGCSTIGNATITQPSAINSSIVSSNATCGLNDGSATVSTTGGTPTYSYLWSSGDSSSTASNLAPGNYSVTVTDINGCNATDTLSISSTGGPSISLTKTDATCSGCSDGNVTANVNGGTSPYTYNWSNGGTTTTISNLVAGNYSVTVTDANSCTGNSSVTITEPASGLSATYSSTNANCGNCDGSATSSVSGGISPYTYQWSNGATTSSVTGLCAGNYIVTVSDNDSIPAQIVDTIIINGSSNPSVTISSTDATCGQSNGIANSTVSGGTPPYTYFWSDSSTTTNLNGLIAGSYSLTVTDANGCTANSNATINNISGPSITINSTDVLCNGGNNGSATTSVTGGVSPYNYLWSSGDTLATISNKPSGTYIVTITDANGCVAIDSGLIADPALLSATASSTDITCNGAGNGTAIVTATGGTVPYSYLWSNGGTSISASNLGAGAHDVTVTDANGCTANIGVIVLEPTAITANATANSSTCGTSNGSASVSASGGTVPYTYLWNSGETITNISGKASGAYSVTVTDANSCQEIAIASISDLSGPTIAISSTVNANCGGPDGSATISVSGGTSPFTYLWSGGSTSANLDTVPPGVYSIEVTDTNGCKGVNSATIGNNGNNAPTISGTVKVDNNNFIVTAGMVYIYKKISTPGQFPPIASTPIDTNGNYLFTSILPIGEYLIKAEADTTLPAYAFTIPTYYTLTYQWDSATLLNAVCDSTYLLDLRIIDLQPLNGTSDLNGLVIADATGKVAGIDLILGDPVPGIDVSLEQIPGGIVARDVTGSDGSFGFTNVPIGNYKLYVDIPGLPMDTTYDVDLVSNDSLITDLNFLVGDSSIYIPDAVGIKSLNVQKNSQVRIYPNPFGSSVNFEYFIKGENDVIIEVFNVLGERVYLNSNKSLSAGRYFSKIDGEEFGGNGIYFVKITIGNQIYSHRINRAN